jgi:F0F1-type ATP synthase membrane subunit b/b'
MRVLVRHTWTVAIVLAAVMMAIASAAVAAARPEHATTIQATNSPPQATQPSEHAAQRPGTATPSSATREPHATVTSEPTATQSPAAASAADHRAAAAGGHQTAAAGAENGEAAAEHGNPLVATIARLFNFALLAGTLFYLLRSPLAVYLTNRSTQIRERLVKAGAMRAGAAAEQVAIATKMRSLPAELEALRTAGAEEVVAEEARIRQAAESERARLLDMTRRDIAVQLTLAERTLMKHAADLAVAVASERVKTIITAADHVRLVDRYLVQVGK